MNRERRTRYYSSYTDDFIETKNQNYEIPKNYKWVRNDLLSRFFSAIVYSAALVLSSVYYRVFLNIRFKNRHVLKQTTKTGAFIYCNHTQPVGDVFNPAIACFPNRIYTLVSPANLGIPFIGKILPYLGALPISDTFYGMKKLSEAIEYRLQQKKCIVIYPEAHVWDYYTDIRPFPETSFRYPVKYDKPVFCMTTTYRQRLFRKRPRITVYIDGPFYRNTDITSKEQALQLRDEVYDCMKNRSKNSTCQYIRYEKI